MPFTITFSDCGTGRRAVDTFGIQIDHVAVASQPPLPNSTPQVLRGGYVFAK